MSNFFNKVAGGINKGVATVGANSKAMMEKTKVKGNITNLENERRHYIQYLGQVIYDMHISTGAINADDAVLSTITEITRRLELIQEQNQELARIDAELEVVNKGAGTPAPAPAPYTPAPYTPVMPAAPAAQKAQAALAATQTIQVLNSVQAAAVASSRLNTKKWQQNND